VHLFSKFQAEPISTSKSDLALEKGMGDKDAATDVAIGGAASASVTEHHAVAFVDSIRNVRIWDISGRVKSKPGVSGILQCDPTQIVYIPKLAWFATSSNDKEIQVQ
jgi:hypothetical protein